MDGLHQTGQGLGRQGAATFPPCQDHAQTCAARFRGRVHGVRRSHVGRVSRPKIYQIQADTPLSGPAHGQVRPGSLERLAFMLGVAAHQGPVKEPGQTEVQPGIIEIVHCIKTRSLQSGKGLGGCP